MHIAYLAEVSSSDDSLADRVVIVRSAMDGALEAMSAPITGLIDIEWDGRASDPMSAVPLGSSPPVVSVERWRYE